MAPERSEHETKSETINLEIVRDDPPPAKRGRPVRLNLRVFLRICRAVEKGSAITHACEAELVTYSHFRFRVSKSPRLQERFKEAEVCRDQVWRSEALASIRAAFPKNWPAAMTFLERRYPNEFALRTVNRVGDPNDVKLIGSETPEERLIQYGRIMREVDVENEQQPIKWVELPDVNPLNC
jgi:hypothetical protein